MRRKSTIPYEETSLLSLQNMTSGSKFQLVTKIIDKKQNIVSLTDDHDKLEVVIENNDLSGLEVGETIIIFGEKTDSSFIPIKIIKSNIDWGLYCKTRELESRWLFWIYHLKILLFIKYFKVP